jgi:hypothetical protein
MILRTMALALALSVGLASPSAFAAKKTHKSKTYKAKKIKPKKDKRFKNAQASKVKPRKAPKRSKG